MPDPSQSLEQELAFFETKKAELLAQHPGKFALIVGSELLGVFDRPEDAYKEGLEKVGNRPMLIKRIVPDDEVGVVPALTFGLLGAGL